MQVQAVLPVSAVAADDLAHEIPAGGGNFHQRADTVPVAPLAGLLGIGVQLDLHPVAGIHRIVTVQLHRAIPPHDGDIEVAVAVVVGVSAAASHERAETAGQHGESAVTVVQEQDIGLRLGHGGNEQVFVTIVVDVEEIDPP